MENLVSLKCSEATTDNDICEVECEVAIDSSISTNSYSIPSVDNSFVYQQLDRINEKIDFLTSDADTLDCLVAASSGILCATIDAVLKEMRINKTFGGNADGKDLLDFFNESGGQDAQKKIKEITDGDKKSGKKTEKTAQKTIEKGNASVKDSSLSENESLEKMIEFLEKRFNIPSDSLEQYFGGTTKHHLNDFAHHPSIIGLFFSMLTQYTYKVYGTDETGAFKVIDIPFEEGHKGKIARIKAGNKIYLKVIGENTKEKWFFGVVVWYYHLVSDIAGSSGTVKGWDKRGISTIGKGAGIPGPLMSLAKALSALPIFNKTNVDGENENQLAAFIDKLYSGDVFEKIDENDNKIKRKVDYRTEKGIKKELAQQSIMVVVNEMIVRGFYFIRHFAMEVKDRNIKKISEINKIDSKNIIPFFNRTVIRMMTIATGSFTATNLAIDAAVSAVKSGGEPVNFVKYFVMRINFVGVGRFFIAIGADVTEGALRARLVNDTSVFAANQQSLSADVESQAIRISQNFADYLDGTFESNVKKHIVSLGEYYNEDE